MISGIFLQTLGFSGGAGSFLASLQYYGLFDYILPFLIIFGLIFGVLSRIQLFGNNKPTYVIISIAVSLLALQFGFVSQFFSEIFPRLGIGLAVILTVFIILGLLNIGKTWNKGIMAIFGLVILFIVLIKSFGSTWYNFGYWLPYNWNWAWVIVIAIVVIGLGTIISNTPKGQPFKWGKTLENIFSSEEYKA